MGDSRSGRCAIGDGRDAVWVFTDRRDGDLMIDGEPGRLAERRRRIVDLPWTWLRQVHGAEVVTVDAPGGAAGAVADGSVTATTGAVLAVHTADCAPVLLIGERGVVGAAHAGWRGATEGVIEATVDAMRALDAGEIEAKVGPCIEPAHYEFGRDDLDRVAERFGRSVRGETLDGEAALDMSAVVAAALRSAGVGRIDIHPGRTGARADRYWSHRVRSDTGRQASLIWIEERR